MSRHLDVDVSGGRVRLRVAEPSDVDALEVGFTHLSADSRYMRFFTAMPRLSGRLLGQLSDLDGVNRLAIAAFDPDRPSEVGTDDGAGIGVGRYVRTDDRTAELALALIDEYHGRGIGRVLLASIVVAADVHGIVTLQAYVLPNNVAMLAMMIGLGAFDHSDGAHDVRLLEIDVGATIAHPSLDPTLLGNLREVLS
jgi:GNAT superfamily N-acetyltransferase